MDEKSVKKKISLELVGIDGNAYAIMGAFKKQALKEGWSDQEVDIVLTEAKSGNYDHLLCTIMQYCE